MKSPHRTLKNIEMLLKIIFKNENLQQIIDGSVHDGQGGGDAAVDDDAAPQHPDDLLVRGLGPEHDLVKVPRDHCRGGEH